MYLFVRPGASREKSIGDTTAAQIKIFQEILGEQHAPLDYATQSARSWAHTMDRTNFISIQIAELIHTHTNGQTDIQTDRQTDTVAHKEVESGEIRERCLSDSCRALNGMQNGMGWKEEEWDDGAGVRSLMHH